MRLNEIKNIVRCVRNASEITSNFFFDFCTTYFVIFCAPDPRVRKTTLAVRFSKTLASGTKISRRKLDLISSVFLTKLTSVMMLVQVCSAMEPIQIHKEDEITMRQNEKKLPLIQEKIRDHVSNYPALFCEEEFEHKSLFFLGELDVLVEANLLLRVNEEGELNKNYYHSLYMLKMDYNDIFDLFKNEINASNILKSKEFHDKCFELVTKTYPSRCQYQIKACEVIIQESKLLSENFLKKMEVESAICREGKTLISSEAIVTMTLWCTKLHTFVKNNQEFLLEILDERERFLVVIDDIRKLFDLKFLNGSEHKKDLDDSSFRMLSTLELSRSILANRRFPSPRRYTLADELLNNENTDDIYLNISKQAVIKERSNEKVRSVKDKRKSFYKTASRTGLSYSSEKGVVRRSSGEPVILSEKENLEIQEKTRKKETKEKKEKK